MEAFLLSLLTCTLTMTAAALLYLAARRPLAKKLTAKSRYYAWLVILIGLLVPFRPQPSHASIRIDLPGMTAADASIPVSNSRIDSSANGAAHQTTIHQTKGCADGICFPDTTIHDCGAILKGPVSFSRESRLVPSAAFDAPAAPLSSFVRLEFSRYELLFVVWAAGALGCLGLQLFRHIRFSRNIRRWSERIGDPSILAALRQLAGEMELHRPVEIKRCPLARSPMLTGFFHPVILLPETAFSADELALILRHELVHAKRGDLYYKTLLMACSAMHWFNPMMRVIRHAVDIDCEISCDEAVLGKTPLFQRASYGKLILKTVRSDRSAVTAFSTSFNGGVRDMKKRLNELFITNRSRKSAWIVPALLVMSVTLCSNFAFAAPSEMPTLSSASASSDTIPEKPGLNARSILPSTDLSQSKAIQIVSRPDGGKTFIYRNGSEVDVTKEGAISGSGINADIPEGCTLAEETALYEEAAADMIADFPELKNRPSLGMNSYAMLNTEIDGHSVSMPFYYNISVIEPAMLTRDDAEKMLRDSCQAFKDLLKQKDLDDFQQAGAYETAIAVFSQIASEYSTWYCRLYISAQEYGPSEFLIDEPERAEGQPDPTEF
ncbi:M56 family metallopeptidase [Candidatus Soleaferrea massiliensis]|uniref:M56 family metallopeptidase n=1 Tax=Candidatus Soleaferrea massiliensis TaxID=1470354 RepID=UPI00058B9066|nr:M56 family metallopeptidase [Candidatus Soleaferrea massiliensis]